MSQGEQIAMGLGFVLTVIVIVVFVGVFVKIAQKSRDQKAQNEYAARYQARNASSVNTPTQQSGLTDAQKTRLDYLREQQKQRQSEKHDLHQADAHQHAHLGEEEHYEEIVGSLGEVNDEGCEDLSGVRFIAHDIAYEISENEHPDYNRLAQAIVMGEILNNPRFKIPYTRK